MKTIPEFHRLFRRSGAGILLAVLLGGLSVRAAETEPEDGYIGCGLIRQSDHVFKVYDLMADSPAAQAGLKDGDQIVAVDGIPVKKRIEGVGTGLAGSVVKLTLLREGSTTELSITRQPFMKIYWEPAWRGQATAVSWLGWYYSCYGDRLGEGSYAKAKTLLQKGAEQGNAFAAYNLGVLYEEGLGIPVDQVEALKWYRQALATEPASKRYQDGMIGAALHHLISSGSVSPADRFLILTHAETFRDGVLIKLALWALAYLLGGGVLVYFTFKAGEAGPNLLLSLGWIGFMAVGQTFVATFYYATGVHFDLNLAFIAAALPVIAVSLGLVRKRLWRPSAASWRWLLLYFAGAVLVFILSNFGFYHLYKLMVHSPIPVQASQPLIKEAMASSLFLSWLVTGCLVPLAEEIVFRGFLFDSLRRRFSGTMTVVLTALAFSALHLQWTYLPQLFVYGLILGGARLKTGSLRLSATLHIFTNSLSVLVMLWIARK